MAAVGAGAAVPAAGVLGVDDDEDDGSPIEILDDDKTFDAQEMCDRINSVTDPPVIVINNGRLYVAQKDPPAQWPDGLLYTLAPFHQALVKNDHLYLKCKYPKSDGRLV